MKIFLVLLVFSVALIGVVFNQETQIEQDDKDDTLPPFGIINPRGHGRTFLSLFGGSQNKPCNTTNAFGYGNATCTIYCLFSGFQQGGICATDGYCTCIT